MFLQVSGKSEATVRTKELRGLVTTEILRLVLVVNVPSSQSSGMESMRVVRLCHYLSYLRIYDNKKYSGSCGSSCGGDCNNNGNSNGGVNGSNNGSGDDGGGDDGGCGDCGSVGRVDGGSGNAARWHWRQWQQRQWR
jgi:hypothetical protein